MSRLIDWKSVCLVCLKKGENRSIFDRDTDSNVIADKIIKCADIFITKDPDKPKNICLQCFDNLNVTYKFHRNYEQSDSIIKVVLSTNHQKFQIKDLWKTIPFRGAQQKESPQKEILDVEESTNSNEINIKHEIVKDDEVDGTHDNHSSPCIDLGDNINTKAKLILKALRTAFFQGSAIEQNDVKANKDNKMCGICNRAYKQLDIHMRRHNNERLFSCDRCDKGFVTSWKLRQHMRVHTGEKPYKCQYCDRRFTQEGHRKSHERIHTGEKPYKCQYCDRRFGEMCHQKTHERMHTGERPFVCPTCGKSFAHSSVLSNHRRIHSDVKKFVCGECGKGFNRRESLDRHIRRHLSPDTLDKSLEHTQNKVLEKEIFQTEECAKSHEIIENSVGNDTHDKDTSPCNNLEDNIDTQAKLAQKDPTEACFQGSTIELDDVKANKGNNMCGICNRAYRQLDIHMRRHNKERPFSCDRCDKAFVTCWKLRQHMTVHTGEKPYECQYCGRRFTQKSHRKTHERKHTGEKPYECQYCDRRFAEKGHQKSHERIHTGERPFVCPTCGKSFAHSYVLSNHRRSHSGVKKLMSGECGEGFNKRASFESYVRCHLSRDKLHKSSEDKQKKVLEKEIFQIEECSKSNEINIKHETKLIEKEIN